MKTMTCKEFVEWVTEYLEGTIPPADLERFEQHRGQCPGCSDYVQQFYQTVHAMHSLPREEVSNSHRQAILIAFRELVPDQTDCSDCGES